MMGEYKVHDNIIGKQENSAKIIFEVKKKYFHTKFTIIKEIKANVLYSSKDIF